MRVDKPSLLYLSADGLELRLGTAGHLEGRISLGIGIIRTRYSSAIFFPMETEGEREFVSAVPRTFEPVRG
jgi:hypothetical protein